MNVLAMNFATGRVDYRYFEFVIVCKAISVKVFCDDAAMRNRVGVRLEFDSDPVSERNTVDHIEEKFLHRSQPRLVLVASRRRRDYSANAKRLISVRKMIDFIESNQTRDDQVQGYDKVQQARNDEDQDPGDKRNKRRDVSYGECHFNSPKRL
jgi:hypothetical protein